jgi:MoxR-like ATPase
MNSRSFVIPEDIKKIAGQVLTHRLVLSYEAIANDISSEYIIKNILDNVKIV